MGPKPRHLREWAALAAGLLLILGEALPFAQGTVLTVAVVQGPSGVGPGGSLVHVDVTLRAGGQPVDATAILFPVTNASAMGPVVFYIDPAYPILGDLGSIYGVWDHLGPELRARGYAGGMSMANATQLADLMNSTATPVVVMATGVMPRTILNRTRNLVRPWLERGGVLVWAGDYLGAYIGGTNTTDVNWDQAWNLQYEGEKDVFGSPVVGVNTTFPGTVNGSTAVSAWLDIRYPYAYEGANLSYLGGFGGFALGGVANNTKDNVSFPHTSLAWIPVGRGGVLLFGYGPVLPYGYSAEDAVAGDIAQALRSGILWWDRSILPGVANVTLDRGGVATVSLNVLVPAGDPAAMVYVYSRGPLPTIGFPQLVTP